MTTTLEKINKTDNEKLTGSDIKKIDDNATKIENALNNLPTGSGSTVTTSATNGNILINGVESKVYTHPTGSTTTNPHGTIASDVGLGNVTNESKTTMFTNPIFTGSVREGYNTIASGVCSHVEGENNIVIGDYSHSEGYGNLSATTYSHTEGKNCMASNGTLFKVTAFDNTNKTVTLDKVTGLSVGNKLDIYIIGSLLDSVSITAINGLVVTLNTIADLNSNCKYVILRSGSLYPTHAEGSYSLASGNYAHAEGNTTIASGSSSHSEGEVSLASGIGSHAEGTVTIASGNYSHAEGVGSVASGIESHSEGYYTTASGLYSHAEGSRTVASGNQSHSEGYYTTAKYLQHVMGQYNTASATTDTSYLATGEAFIIGNGTGSSALGNAFKVMFNGLTYADGAYASTGADYAEYFEWNDENSSKEDRVGYFVTLDGEKIKKANSTDNYILGIVSATPSVVGDNYESWQDKYITDEFGRIQYEDVLVPTKYETIDDKQVVISEEHTDTIPKYNPNWNSTQEYISRENRPEWSPIGIIGKLLVKDDGTCVVNGYCKSNDDGIATKSDTGYRVMKRISDNIIQVLVK